MCSSSEDTPGASLSPEPGRALSGLPGQPTQLFIFLTPSFNPDVASWKFFLFPSMTQDGHGVYLTLEVHILHS